MRRRRFLENIIGDTRRLTALLQRLRDLAQVENPQGIGQTTVEAIATEVSAAYPDLAISWNVDSIQSLAFSRENGAILFSHLADNATQHGATELRIDIDMENRGDLVTVTVTDNGAGISLPIAIGSLMPSLRRDAIPEEPGWGFTSCAPS